MTYIDQKNKFHINIGICGAVSAGKSTLLNSLFVEQYSEMKIKRTTMVPQVYYETDMKTFYKLNNKEIRERNNKINTKLLKKGENGEKVTLKDIKEVKYFVPPVYNLLDLPKNIFLTVYDIPGLNDGTNNIYYDYLNNNFDKFDLIIFVVDINSALNTSDEVKILETILENISKKYQKNNNSITKMLVLANKCDELSISNENEYELDDEHQEMYQQIENIIKQKITKFNLDIVIDGIEIFNYKLIPISSEDSYIYRMYERNSENKMESKYFNKLGLNEFGKSKWNQIKSQNKAEEKIKSLMETIDINIALNITGFNNFKINLNNLLSSNTLSNMITNHIVYDMATELKNINDKSIIYPKGDQILENFEEDNIDELFIKIINTFTCIDYYYQEKLLELIKIFPKFGKNIKSIFLDHVKTSYNFQIIGEKNIINEDDYNHVYKFKKLFHIILKSINYHDLKNIIYSTLAYNKVVDNLNKFCIIKINEKKSNIDKTYNYLANLYENNYVFTNDIIKNFFENKDILTKKPNQILNYIELLQHNNMLINIKKIDIIKNILLQIYKNKYKMSYVPNNILSYYSYVIDIFWSAQIQNLEKNISEDLIIFGYLAKRNQKFWLSTDADIPTDSNIDEYLLLEHYYINLINSEKTNIYINQNYNNNNNNYNYEM